MSGMYRHRLKIQVLAAALLNGYVLGFQKGKIFTGKAKAFCVPVLNCYSCPGALGSCPIGALQTALGAGHHVPFYVLGLLMVFGILAGRLVCGFLCPFGLVQDLLYKIPIKKRKVPEKIDRKARYIKYGVLLVMALFLPALMGAIDGIGAPYFCQYLCPAGTLEGGLPLVGMNPALQQIIGGLFQWKVLVLLGILAASAVIHRPFCRYLCPLGAFYGLFNRFSFYQMEVRKDKCISCKRCEEVCPMTVSVTENINSGECIRCGRCRTACPTDAIISRFQVKK
ncbi:MAG: 4Fe-4S binding protein [Firmicutes bacterium]|nr:4Fe-4S binding protein [Bacillota bacterium]